MRLRNLLFGLFCICFCHAQDKGVSLVVLGTIQDGGSPHIGCQRSCCAQLFLEPDPKRKVVSLGVVDHRAEKSYLFEATPDLPEQLKLLKTASEKDQEVPDGIFLTHAHMGHYAGLLYLGREALGGSKVPVYAMPKMQAFLETNGPWSQLVQLHNILLQPLQHKTTVSLTDQLVVTPFLVPHRDEFSETVGYKIQGPTKTALFIPDINKWKVWETSISEVLKEVDYAFLDATFFDNQELNNRDMGEIPHPFVVESMELFDALPEKERDKVYFIHLNHSNPLLQTQSDAFKSTVRKGYHVAQFLDVFKL